MPRLTGVIKIFIIVGITVSTILGCANRGSGPQGGPKDTTPPRIVKYNPENNSTNVNTHKINLSFNEIVLVENSFEKVIISPPQTNIPVIKALGHKVNVELRDSLKPNTTYTINFTDAIVDNNEKNKLEGFTYSFSTGDFLDTLTVSGIVIDSENLNPVPNIMVGIHRNLHDSAFTSLPFDRITKTDSKGEFVIKNVHEGDYRIFALSDIGNNFFFDIPTEQIAFSDSVYTPVCHTEITYDTVFSYAYLDSAKQIVDSTSQVIDSVITRINNIYAPDSIILQTFTELNTRQYLAQSERKNPFNFTLYFGNRCDSLPRLRCLNDVDSVFEYILQAVPTVDTLTYWLTDSLIWSQDTLELETSYWKIDDDSSYWRTDTLSLVYRAPKKKNDEMKRVEKILSSNVSNKFEIYDPLLINFKMPTSMNDSMGYQLQQLVDTVWRNLPSVIVKVDSVGFRYRVDYDWKPETSYRLKVDSALFVAFNGMVNEKDSMRLTVKSLEEYSTLIFNIENYKGCEVIQILDKDEKVVRQVETHGSKTKIEFITPGKYYARLFLDDNGNGKWDTGSYKDKRHAERFFYFPYEIELRAFWDVEEDWDINEFPLLEQKPEELVKTDSK